MDWVLDEDVNDRLLTKVRAAWDQSDDGFHPERSGHGKHVLALWFDQEAETQEGAVYAAQERVRDFVVSVPIDGRIGRIVAYGEGSALVLDPPDGGPDTY